MLQRYPRCGKDFDGVKAQRLCPDCRAAAQNAARMIKHTCKTCGTEFVGAPRASYCPDCRRERQRVAEAKCRAAKRAGTVRAIGSTDICKRCGQPYTVSGGLQQYCPVCGLLVLAEKSAPVKRLWAARHRTENSTYKKDLATNGTICVICGKPFTTTSSVNTCSPSCTKEQKRLRQLKNDIKRGHSGKRSK